MDWRIVPFDVDASILVAFPIHGNPVVFFEFHLEVTGVAFSDIFHSKIIKQLYKDDGAPLMVPQAWGGCALVVAMLGYAFA